MEKLNDLTTELLRRKIGSINIDDVEKPEMTEEERKQYVSIIHTAFPYILADIKRFQTSQLLFSSIQALSWEQSLVGRGSFNGMDLLKEYWQNISLEHKGDKVEEDKDFDKHNVISEL